MIEDVDKSFFVYFTFFFLAFIWQWCTRQYSHFILSYCIVHLQQRRPENEVHLWWKFSSRRNNKILHIVFAPSSKYDIDGRRWILSSWCLFMFFSTHSSPSLFSRSHFSVLLVHVMRHIKYRETSKSFHRCFYRIILIRTTFHRTSFRVFISCLYIFFSESNVTNHEQEVKKFTMIRGIFTQCHTTCTCMCVLLSIQIECVAASIALINRFNWLSF